MAGVWAAEGLRTVVDAQRVVLGGLLIIGVARDRIDLYIVDVVVIALWAPIAGVYLLVELVVGNLG